MSSFVENVNTTATLLSTIDPADIVAVSANSANITIVATDIANVNTTATNITNVNTTATNISNVNTVAGDTANINALASDLTNVNLVAADLTHVDTVATNVASVNTVAGSITDVNSVSTHMTDVTTAASNITAIQNASANAATATTQAGIATIQAGIATTQASAASTSAGNASTSASNASASEVLAQKYAENPEDVAVVTGEYSAKHWAAKAAYLVTTGVINDGSTSAIMTWSSDKINTQLGTKQATLSSGTNIKTVNSTSLLGSGDIAVQPTLVSGTNIKSINGSSILGSGNLVLNTGQPTFQTDTTTAIVATSATLNGTISDFGESTQTLQYRFVWGTTSSMVDGSTTWTAATSVGSVSSVITVASTSTIYYAALQVKDTQKPNSMGILTSSYTTFTSDSAVVGTTVNIYGSTTGSGITAFDGTSVPTLTNGTLVSNEFVANASSGSATTYEFHQDNTIKMTPSLDIYPLVLAVDGTSTASVPVFTSVYDSLFTTGAKLWIDDGGTIKEVTAGTVTKSSGVLESTVDIFSDSSCKALYRFENNANDTSGTYNGTATNVTYSTGKFGQGAVFNGTSSYVSTPITGATYRSGAGYTISLWASFADLAADRCLVADNTVGCIELSRYSDNTLGFRALKSDNSTPVITTVSTHFTPVLNQFYHIVIAWDGTTAANAVKLYVNNSIVATKTASLPLSNQGDFTTTFIGRRTDGLYFYGSIDQARIFNRALTALEVQNLYTEGVKYSLASVSPTLTNNPSWAAVGGQKLQIGTSSTSNGETYADASGSRTITRSTNKLTLSHAEQNVTANYFKLKALTTVSGDKVSKFYTTTIHG